MIGWGITSKDYCVTIENQQAQMRAWCKPDGCLEFYRWHNNDEKGMMERIHICDIDEMISHLQEVKRISQEFFNGPKPTPIVGEEDWDYSDE